MLAAVALSIRETDPVAGTGRLLGRLLLLSATVYPWYLLWVLPWAALQRRFSWLLLGALLPLCYLPAIAGIPLQPWVFLLIWGPFWAAEAWQRSGGATRRGPGVLPRGYGL